MYMTLLHIYRSTHVYVFVCVCMYTQVSYARTYYKKKMGCRYDDETSYVTDKYVVIVHTATTYTCT